GLEPFDAIEWHWLNERAEWSHRRRRLEEASRDYARLLELDPPSVPSPEQARRIMELAPLLQTRIDEPFALEDCVAIHHPSRSLIAYHLFWDDDIDFPEDNDPTDHEIIWVEYEPVSGKPLRVQS